MALSRDEMRDGLLERTKKNYARKEEIGRFVTFFKSDVELQFWRPGKGVHIIDILPYVSGSHDPDLKKGKPTYNLDLLVHQNIGVSNGKYICPIQYGKDCPICEHQRSLKDVEDYDEDLYKSLFPTRRSVYNVLVYDNDEEENKGVQVWDVAHFYMEKKILSLTKDARTGETINFALPDKNGKSIQFEIITKKDNPPEYLGHRFVDRDYTISKEDQQSVHCLDELIVLKDYDELSIIHFGPDTDDDEDDNKEETVEVRGRHRGRKRTPDVDTNEDDTDDSDDLQGECPHGGELGVDLDLLEECNNCDVYDLCVAKSEELDDTTDDENEDELEDENEDDGGEDDTSDDVDDTDDIDENDTRKSVKRVSSRRKQKKETKQKPKTKDVKKSKQKQEKTEKPKRATRRGKRRKG